jgi:hypothetical protein
MGARENLLTIEAIYKLNEEILQEGFALHFAYKRPFLKYYPYLGAVLLVTAAATFNRFENRVAIPAFLLALLFLLAPTLIRFLNKQSIKRVPFLNQEIAWRFDEETIAATMPAGEFSLPWNNLKDALLATHGILLYPQVNTFYWLPESAFHSQKAFQQVKQYVQMGVPKHKEI